MKIRQHNREQVMRLKRHYIMTTLLIGLLFSLSACATMNEASSKFTKTKSADVAYFADTTIALVGDADFGLTRDDAIYTREFFDREGATRRSSHSKLRVWLP